MATVTRENISNLHDKLVVKLTKEDYLPSFEKSLKNYGKNINIPGFRKGNVPASLVKKMYGQSVFTDEVLKIAGEELNNYMKNENIAIFANPLALPMQNDQKFDMAQPADFEFPFEIGLKPNFDITPLTEKKGTITRYKIKVSDKILDEEINNLRRRAGKVENPDTVEKDDNIIYADYIACNVDGKEDTTKEKSSDVVTLDKMPAKLQAQLKGAQAEKTIIFTPSDVCTEEELPEFLKDALKQDVANEDAKNQHFKLTLTKIGHLVPRDLDEAFFEEVFPGNNLKSEEEFRNRMREEVSKQMSQYGNEKLQNDIYEMLVHETPIELPTDFLKSWLQRGGEKEKTNEEVEKEFPSFDHQLRWTLISDKLMRDNKIEVSHDEVMNDIATKVRSYFGMKEGEDAEWIASYLQRMTKDEKTMDETYRRLMFDKLFTKIEDQMEVKEQEVTEEEFAQLPSAHHHHH